MLRIMQPSQREDSYDSNPKATSKPPHKPSARLTKQPDAARASPHLDPASNSQTEAETLPCVKRFNIFLLTKIATLETRLYHSSSKYARTSTIICCYKVSYLY